VLELIPTGLDLYQLEMDILSEGAESGSGRAALFDSAAGTFYLASDLVDPTPTQEFEVAAEYTRALLHQHYEIGNRLRSLDGDERKALDTLVLGDATLTGQEYMSTHVTPQRLVNLPTRGPMPVLDAAPYFIEQRGFFIQAGVNLMSAVQARADIGAPPRLLESTGVHRAAPAHREVPPGRGARGGVVANAVHCAGAGLE
jgi:hypothetical protein